MLRRRVRQLDPVLVVTAVIVAVALVALAFAVGAGPAHAASGGIGLEPSSGQPTKAKLAGNGEAIPPAGAPKEVVRAIKAGNKIRRKPYRWGGGHRRFKDSGYDCSGAVSYVLHAAKMLDSPLPSGPLMRWGQRGKGDWITVYAHGGHTYAMIAGLRWDTSGTGGKGPRWQKDKRSKRGFAVRHFAGF